MTIATTVTPPGILKCLAEIRDTPSGQLAVVVNPETPNHYAGGVGIQTFRAGELSAIERVGTFKSCAARGLIHAHPGTEGQYGNRIQLLELTQLGEEVLQGAPIPLGPGEQAHDSELGMAGDFKRAARAIEEHERMEREAGEVE